MTTKHSKNIADYILPLNMNGLSGRMLKLPSSNKNRNREILLLYGSHASIERMYGVVENLSQYGNVTLPDLPGFGGMEPFYKIGEKPDVDTLADYLAAFIKLRYKNRRFSIISFSLSFAVTTRMLQKYPEIAKKVDHLISAVGFVDKDDLRIKRRNYIMLYITAWVFKFRLPALFFRHVILNPTLIRFAYKIGGGRVNHPKYKGMSQEEYENLLEFEIKLWHVNEVRTYMYTALEVMNMRLPRTHVDLAVHHISVDVDRYFDNASVEQHMRLIYKDFSMSKADISAHVPTVVATAEEAAPLIPPAVRALLRKKS